MKAAAPLALLALVVGCASEPTPQAAKPPADGTLAVVCNRDTPVGTNFAVTRCRTPEQIAKERAETERLKDSIRPVMSANPESGGR